MVLYIDRHVIWLLGRVETQSSKMLHVSCDNACRLE